ncbi:MAG: hypothetical protein K6C12_02600 [Oscillospiraceae bacterium]|nr:hypothetical protein [Oscillospiraceae bacterium]
MKYKTLREQIFYPLLGSATLAVAIEILSLLTDNIIVGRVVGETGLAGINTVVPLFSFCAFLGGLICVGVSFRYADAIGRFEERRAGNLLGMGILLAVGTGVVMWLASFAAKKLYFAILSPAEEIRAEGEAYYRYICLVMLIYPVFVLLLELVYDDGDIALCNVAYGMQMLGNVGLSILLCIRMGTGGASLGTLIGTAASLCTLLLHFAKKKNGLRPHLFFSWSELKAFLRYGFTDAGVYLLWAVLFYILNAFVIRRFGDGTLPVLAVVTGFFELTIVFDGLGQAMKPIVSVYHAERNSPAISKTMKFMLRCALAEGVLATAAVLILADVMPLAFSLRDPVSIRESALALRIIAPSLTAISALYLYSSYYLNVERIGLSVWITVWKDLISVLLLSLPMSLLLGVHGLWAGILLAPFLTVLIWYVTVRLRLGEESFPLLLKEDPDIADFDLHLSEEEILTTRDRAEEFLRSRGIPATQRAQAMLLIEDLSMLTAERNPEPGKLCAEWTLLAEKKAVRMIFRDCGAVEDLTDPNEKVSSFRSFVVSSYMEKQKVKKYLMTVGMNRTVLEVPRERKGS